ncbi:MAG: hypothetical protein K2X47_07370, partial [Bdellovibrionales bacterium]|nr:hypothetical protein [Bdellovibrionales bacterium]
QLDREKTSDADVAHWIQRFRESGALSAVVTEIRDIKEDLIKSTALKKNPGLHQFVVDLVDLALAPIQKVMEKN